MKQLSNSGSTINGKRPRGRFGTRGNGSNKFSSSTQSFENSGGEARPRNNMPAKQTMEKYLALARDAHTSGDRVAAEGYMQHAEHYYRCSHASEAEIEENNESRDSSNRRSIRGRNPKYVPPQETVQDASSPDADSQGNQVAVGIVTPPPPRLETEKTDT